MAGKSNADLVEQRRIDELTGKEKATERAQMIRMEALRMAERIVSQQPWWRRLEFDGVKVTRAKGTILLANKLTTWIERGVY